MNEVYFIAGFLFGCIMVERIRRQRELAQAIEQIEYYVNFKVAEDE